MRMESKKRNMLAERLKKIHFHFRILALNFRTILFLLFGHFNATAVLNHAGKLIVFKLQSQKPTSIFDFPTNQSVRSAFLKQKRTKPQALSLVSRFNIGS